MGYTANKKKLINAKEIKLGCGNICRLKCSLSISELSRQQLFNYYWQLGSVDRQRDFLSKCIEPGDVPKYRYPHTATRDLNYSYNFCINNIKHRLNYFSKIHPILVIDQFRMVISRLNNKRGKHKDHKKLDFEIKQSVRNHINSIPRIESHYLRAQTTREYIEGGKSLADLYRDYSSLRIEKQYPQEKIANLTMYSRIFNTEFNISFFCSQKGPMFSL